MKSGSSGSSWVSASQSLIKFLHKEKHELFFSQKPGSLVSLKKMYGTGYHFLAPVAFVFIGLRWGNKENKIGLGLQNNHNFIVSGVE